MFQSARQHRTCSKTLSCLSTTFQNQGVNISETVLHYETVKRYHAPVGTAASHTADKIYEAAFKNFSDSYREHSGKLRLYI